MDSIKLNFLLAIKRHDWESLAKLLHKNKQKGRDIIEILWDEEIEPKYPEKIKQELDYNLAELMFRY